MSVTIDEAIHAVRNKLYSKNGTKWFSFEPNWFDEYERVHEDYDYYEYYYAEDELYIIRNRLTHELWFTTARSPYEAFIKYSKHATEAYGHTYRGRDYSCEDYRRDFCANCVGNEDCDKIPMDDDGSIMTDFRYTCKNFENADFDF